MNSRFAFFLVAVFASTVSAENKARKCSQELERFSVMVATGRGENHHLVYNGAPLDLHAVLESEYLSSNLTNKNARFFLGYGDQVFAITYCHSRVLNYSGEDWKLNVISSPDFSFIDNIAHAYNHSNYANTLLTKQAGRLSLENKLFSPDQFAFYNDTLFYEGREWMKWMSNFVKVDDGKQKWEWSPGGVVDPVDGKFYAQDTKNELEEKLLAVVDGQKVKRRQCFQTSERPAINGTEEIGLDAPRNFFCFYFNDCEIAFGSAAVFYDILVIPKDPIKMKPTTPSPASTTPSTSTLSSFIISSSEATTSTPVENSSPLNGSDTTPKTAAPSKFLPVSNFQAVEEKSSLWIPIICVELVALAIIIVVLGILSCIAFHIHNDLSIVILETGESALESGTEASSKANVKPKKVCPERVSINEVKEYPVTPSSTTSSNEKEKNKLKKPSSKSKKAQ
ncbi:hypothetical protein L596_025865 [Steinernema carpocapsae]|uniref:C-type lectin domain-containing protein n=1 Tax=Steinernema carpocapsae TaxID=34508 RepID=A0A4U5M910_STECR|nr:hypothetical protein L596_025865 [Steinernema carpocapsae]